MDTKYQSRIFSGILFLAAIITMAVSLITCFEKKLDLQENDLSYFRNSPEIHDMVLRYAKNLQRYFIYYGNFDVEAAEEKLSEIDKYITTGQIEPKKKDYTVIIRPYITDEAFENSPSAEDKKSEEKPEDYYNINIEAMTVDSLLDYQAKLSDAISNYNSVKDYINNNSDFNFILYNNRLGHIVATNTENFYNEECYESISITDEIFNTNFNGEILSAYFKNLGLSCEISIPLTTSNNVKILMSTLHRQLSNNKIFSSWIVSGVLLGAALLLLLFVYIYDKGFLKEFNKRAYGIFSKIPMIVLITVFCGIVQIIIRRINAANAVVTELVIYGHIFHLLFTVFGAVFTIIFTFLFIEHIIMLIKNRSLVMKIPDIMFISRGISEIRLALNAGKIFFAIVMIGLQVTITGLVCILFLLLINFYLFLPYIVTILGVMIALVVFYNACSSEFRLRYYIYQMARGNMEVVPEQKGMFTNSINQLNRIRENFQRNLDETLRSERLKTDLITNVSHDLKTPLTSIISYVDLLAAMDTESDEAKEYIEVVRNKSRRLKTLIDDLFEASKLSSGQMKLKCVTSDIVSLLEQTLGELSCKIENAGIEFVVTNTQSPVFVYIDGERMWRVFDNLINNILKYSPKGSRAYIDIKNEAKIVTITFKNVANYHMEFQADELFERFKRGDIARTTEGSGLGLSIAKSIVELHGGTMNIITDGDLFKIIVVLNKNNTEDSE